MLYAMLCYNNEDTIFAWSKEQNDAVMDRLTAVEEKLKKQGRLGPTARLMPTSAATTLRKQTEPPLVIDGPFAETKEQLLGICIIDCASLEEAVDTAKELGPGHPGGSSKSGRFMSVKDNRVEPMTELAWIDAAVVIARPHAVARCCAISAIWTGRRSLSGSLSARPEPMAGEWAAPRSGGLADFRWT